MSCGNLAARRPALILLSGMPGAGKTTFARALSACLDFDHLESDAVRRGLLAKPAYTPEESARVFGVIETRAEDSLAAGRNVLVDATNLTRADRRRFIHLAGRVDAALVAVRLTAPEAVVRERLSRPRGGYSQADLAVYESMRGREQAFSVASVMVDTRFDIEPSVALVVRLMEAATA